MEDNILQIPRRIRELREILDCSAAAAAYAVGVPEETYLAYEQGAEDIPIGKLHKIAVALQVDFSELLTGEAPRMADYTIVRKGMGARVDRFEGYRYENLALNFRSREMEPMIVTLEPKDSPTPPVTHSGQEFNLVLSGAMRVSIGKRSFVLREGDSVYFDATIPHSESAENGLAKFLTVFNEKQRNAG
jgi:quercetin dioxygenase-like cupin family protein/DNA-binding XRE family transcriptional regulator